MTVSAESIERYVSDPCTLDRIRGALSRLVAIPSVSVDGRAPHIFGDESARALDEALLIGRELGFETENHDYYCGSVVLPCAGSADEIGIIAHIDVVPAVEGWSFPRFELTERNGLFIGRGVHDDKGPAVAALAAMCFFAESGIKLPFSIRLILGSDEERGMDDLPHFLAAHSAPRFSFSPDSEFPVCIGEKGISELNFRLCPLGGALLDFHGGSVTNSVADTAYALVPRSEAALKAALPERIKRRETPDGIEFTAAGLSAHAARPEGSVNAVKVLAEFILSAGLLPAAGEQAKALAYIVETTSDDYGTAFGIAASHEVMGPLTCVCGKVFVDDGAIVMNRNIRYPVGVTYDSIFAAVSAHAAACGYSVSAGEHSEGYYVSSDRAEIKALTSAAAAYLGDGACEPYTMGGGTYARSFPNTVAFGAYIPEKELAFGPGKGTAHQRDEYWRVDDLLTSVKIFIRALANLAGFGE